MHTAEVVPGCHHLLAPSSRASLGKIALGQVKFAAIAYPVLMAAGFIGAIVTAYVNPKLLEPVPPPQPPVPVSAPDFGKAPFLNLAPGLHIKRVQPPIDPNGEADSPALVSSIQEVPMRLPNNAVLATRASVALPKDQRDSAMHSAGRFNCFDQLRPNGRLLGTLCQAKD